MALALRKPDVRVDDAAISTAWQRVDLGSLAEDTAAPGPAGLPPAAALPSATWGWGAPVPPQTTTSRPRSTAGRAVPPDAFVVVGRVPGLPEPSRKPVASLTANDNARADPAGRSRAGAIARDIVFLLILAATIYGAYASGRMTQMETVIVVPESALPAGTVT